MSDFLEKAKKTGRIKELHEAFKEYPVEEEYHQGKIENVIQIEEENEEYYLYTKGDIVFVSDYYYDNGEKGKNHLFVIIEKNIGVPLEYFGMLISSNLDKLKYKSNEFLEKNLQNHLNKDSIVKTDMLYKINENNILFKIGVVDEEKIEQYKKRYLEIQ